MSIVRLMQLRGAFGAPRVFVGRLTPDGEALGVYRDRIRELKPLFVLDLETGLRREDLLTLKRSSVDFRSGWIRVAVQKTTREALIATSKPCRQAPPSFRRRDVVRELVCVGEIPRSPSHLRERTCLAGREPADDREGSGPLLGSDVRTLRIAVPGRSYRDQARWMPNQPSRTE